MPGPRLDDTTPEPPTPFTCPACGATSHHPDDPRFGYCGHCKDFTGGPTGFVAHGDRAFGERVGEAVRHRFKTGQYDGQPILLTDEEREELHARNLAAFRAHERMALSIPRPRHRRQQSFDECKREALRDPRVRLWYTMAVLRWHLWDRWTTPRA